MYTKIFKRIFDIGGAIIGLLLLCWIFLLVAIFIKLDSKGPIIFKQARLGYKGNIFQIYKFRSMEIEAEMEGTGVYSMENDKRVTKVGKFIRATSIDELPQLLNILKGEMSFVGPRPALTYHPWQFSDYSLDQRKMFDMRPGLTGWAQVNGRKGVEWNRRIELNVWYIDHVSFILDLKILFLTFIKVIMGTDNVNIESTKR